MKLVDFPAKYRRLPTDTEFKQWQDAGDKYRSGVCVGPDCTNRPIWRGSAACGRDVCFEWLATVPDDVVAVWDAPTPGEPVTVLIAMTRLELAGYGAVLAFVSAALTLVLYSGGMRYGWPW